MKLIARLRSFLPFDDNQDIATARRALKAGDFKQAAHHLSVALSTDPLRRDWLDLLDQVIAAAGPNALWIAPLGSEPHYSIGAIHAYILASQGHVTDAICLLMQVQRAAPRVPYPAVGAGMAGQCECRRYRGPRSDRNRARCIDPIVSR